MNVKRWWNAAYPFYRLCLYPWCWRGQVYDHCCHLHQYRP